MNKSSVCIVIFNHISSFCCSCPPGEKCQPFLHTIENCSLRKLRPTIVVNKLFFVVIVRSPTYDNNNNNNRDNNNNNRDNNIIVISFSRGYDYVLIPIINQKIGLRHFVLVTFFF